MKNQKSQPNINQPAPPVEPSQPPQKKRLKFGLSIVVVIICLVATGVAVYWIKTEPIEQTESNINIKKASDETSNWQTYRNEEYGFEIKYPEGFQLIEKYLGTEGDEFLATYLKDKVIQLEYGQCKSLPPADDHSCNLSIIMLQTDYNLQAFIIKRLGLDEFSQGAVIKGSFFIKSDIIGGNNSEAYKVSVLGMGKNDQYYIKKGNNLLIIVDWLDWSKEHWSGQKFNFSGDEISYQILSTFKFIK